MTFKELLAIRETKLTASIRSTVATEAARKALAAAASQETKDAAALLEATQSITDRLSTLGEHYVVDERGSLLVYKLCTIEPGFHAVMPIPGTDPTPVQDTTK